jgi:hypothetical protein
MVVESSASLTDMRPFIRISNGVQTQACQRVINGIHQAVRTILRFWNVRLLDTEKDAGAHLQILAYAAIVEVR